MMKRLLIPIIAILSLASCNLVSDKTTSDGNEDSISYSFACLDSAVSGSKTNRAISRTTDLIRDIAVSEDEISDEVQNQYGDAFHKDAIETKTFVLAKNPTLQASLDKVLNDLLAVRPSPSGIKYSIYALEDEQVNAFTFGGHIYMTKGMLAKTKSDPALLYAIVGHEIGHSEKGHIRKTIQEMELSEKIFGEDEGLTFFQIKKLLTGSFNQKNELEADYYGTMLTNKLNFDVCSAVKFWREMAVAENQYSRLEDFFRTHPFSELRAQCLQQHIRENYQQQCPAAK